MGEAEAVGLVDRWPDAEGGPSVVLSALSVACLGLRATSDGERWLRPGEREPVRHRRFDGIDDEEFGLGWIAGDDPGALEQLVAELDIDRRRKSAAAKLVRPAASARQPGGVRREVPDGRLPSPGPRGG